MTLSLFDILSKIIPGGLLFFTIVQSNSIQNFENNEVVILIVIYIIGYLIEAISSLIESPVIFRFFGVNPAVNLLNGKRCFGIGISEDEISEILTHTNSKIIENKLELFYYIHSLISKKNYPRINQFLEQYTMSRNILVSSIISSNYFLLKHFSSLSLIICISLIIIIFIRTKQRNYYFAKEVITTYMYGEIGKDRSLKEISITP